MSAFSGIWVAMVTPFNEGQVDLAAAQKLASSLIKRGIAGLVICGTTGEAAALSKKEQLELLDSILAVVPAQQVVMGLAGNNMREVLEQQQAIQQRHIAGLLVPAPYYIRPSQSGLISYFNQIADAAVVPVILYHVPYRTGSDLTLDSLRQLARHRNIHAIKDCGGNVENTMALIDDGDIAVLTGEDALILTTLCLGGSGAISTCGQVYPERFAALVEQVAKGDLASARQNFYSLLPFIQQMFKFASPAPVKYALSQQGYIAPELREPLQPVPAEQQQLINQLLQV